LFLKKIYNYLSSKFIKFILDKKLFISYEKKISHNNIDLKFKIVNYISFYRAKTFSYKEPETLNWIENFEEDSVFFDIGANVGLYSIYAVKSRNCNVYCFEPSVFNLELLVNNTQLNKVSNKINIIPIALYNKNSIQRFNLSNLDKAAALSNFGNSFDQYGNEMKIKGYYNTIGMRLDYLVNIYNIKKPDYIKIDVDGIEHLILQGMGDLLDDAKSILIELTSTFKDQYEISQQILKSKNFFLDKNISSSYDTGNQIWIKNK
tara:strand:- start:268 stop:1053 length:786 start_codon:yes stop_codon:yes gene_type:complete